MSPSAQPASDGTPKRARLVFGPLLAFHPLSLYVVEVSFQKKKKKGKHKYLHVIPTEFYLGSLAACTSRSHSILKSLRWQRSLSPHPSVGKSHQGNGTARHTRCPEILPAASECSALLPCHRERKRGPGSTRLVTEKTPDGRAGMWRSSRLSLPPGAGEGGSPPRGPRTPRFPSSSALPANRGLVSGRLDTGHEPLRRSLIIIFRPHVFFPKPRLAKGSSD